MMDQLAASPTAQGRKEVKPGNRVPATTLFRGPSCPERAFTSKTRRFGDHPGSAAVTVGHPLSLRRSEL